MARTRTRSRKPARPRRAMVWKALGLAGLAGVAATGVFVARDERRRREVAPEEVRDRLHQRYAEARTRDDDRSRDEA